MKQGSDGKIKSLRHSPTGSLPAFKLDMCYSLLALPLRFLCLHIPGARVLITAVTVLTGAACSKAPGMPGVLPAPDSLTVMLAYARPCDTVDIFVFKDMLTQKFESHLRSAALPLIRIPVENGDKQVVILGNVQGIFTSYPTTYPEMEHIIMRYSNDLPERPLMSAQTACHSAGECSVTLTPLLCEIRIESVSYEADAPLKSPVACLENVSLYTEILRSDGFYPAETSNFPEGMKDPMMIASPLPHDIVSVPYDPQISLWCYPNESDPGPGAGQTGLSISGSVYGEWKQYRMSLGRIKRGETIKVCITLNAGGGNVIFL